MPIFCFVLCLRSHVLTSRSLPAQAREKALAKAHQEYLDDNPAAKKLLADFISSALVEQPIDVFEFARQHFKGTATEVDEAAEAGGAGGDDGEPGDQDDLDDLDDMAGGSNSELTAYLKEVFDSIDVDGSGSISKNELKAKLAKDNELQTLLEASGGDGNWYVLEQLDVDGDGEVTWMEYAAPALNRTHTVPRPCASQRPPLTPPRRVCAAADSRRCWETNRECLRRRPSWRAAHSCLESGFAHVKLEVKNLIAYMIHTRRSCASTS